MTARMPLSALAIFLSTYRHETNEQRLQLYKRRDGGIPNRNCNLRRVVSSVRDTNSATGPTPSDTVRQFYKCINEKNIKRLEEHISDDCFVEDFSFPKPFKGKKEVLRFLEQLTTGMGRNVEFHVGHIYEGEDLVAGVDWHLEWKKQQVPFTRGCSLYRLTREGERLTIRRAQVFIESPIKPGDLFLTLLKIVTSLFDAFPEATEWFFRSQYVIVQLLLNMYSIILVPFVTPMLSFYVNLGNLIMRFVSLALKILDSCSRLFTRREN